MKKLLLCVVMSFVLILPSAEVEAQRTTKEVFFGKNKGKKILTAEEAAAEKLSEQLKLMNGMTSAQKETSQKLDSVVQALQDSNRVTKEVSLKILKELVKVLNEQTELLRQLNTTLQQQQAVTAKKR